MDTVKSVYAFMGVMLLVRSGAATPRDRLILLVLYAFGWLVIWFCDRYGPADKTRSGRR